MATQNEFNKFAAEINKRNGNISARQFHQAFAVAMDYLCSSASRGHLTIHRKKATSGNPLITLVARLPENVSDSHIKTVSTHQFRETFEVLATPLENGTIDYVRICKMNGQQEGQVVGYAFKPGAVILG